MRDNITPKDIVELSIKSEDYAISKFKLELMKAFRKAALMNPAGMSLPNVFSVISIAEDNLREALKLENTERLNKEV